MPKNHTSLFNRIETQINNYLTESVQIAPEVYYSQYKTIKRIHKFKNKDLGAKIADDLSYNYYYDIVSPRIDSLVKNLRFDTKNLLIFSNSPVDDFAAVFLANASLKSWMAENGEDEKLKTSIEEFVANGNVGFKRTATGYERVDPLFTYYSNIKAETVEDTDIIECHNMTATQIRRKQEWDQDVAREVIEYCGDKTFGGTMIDRPERQAGETRYEIFEFTGEVNEKEYNEAIGIDHEGDENTYFLAKIITAGLSTTDEEGNRYVLFAERLPANQTMSDYYIYAHAGRYEGRFWRQGVYETLFDHQVRANQIGNDLARGLEWASKVVFKSADTRPLENIRADIENGDIIHNAESLTQLEVRMQGVDQLIADWNRLMQDADRLTNSFEVVRGENLPSGTAFRLGLLMDQNAGKYFVTLRQKIALPYKRVFREWVMSMLLKDMKGKDVFRFTGDSEVVEQLRSLLVDSWYADNLVEIGPHTKEEAFAIKQEKYEELQESDPEIMNVKDMWQGILPRLFVTITGEEYLGNEQVQDIMQLLPYEQDIDRINYMLDTVYKIRGLNIPPKTPLRAKQKPEQPQVGGQPQEEGMQQQLQQVLGGQSGQEAING